MDPTQEEEAEMLKFKEQTLYREIIESEQAQKVFSEWVDFNSNEKWRNESEGESLAGNTD